MIRRQGMTAIEVMTVIAIAALLAGTTVPILVRAFHRSHVQEGAERIVRAHRIARQLAQTQQTPPLDGTLASYGVAIRHDGNRVVVEVLHGSDASDILLAADGSGPLYQAILPPSVQVWFDDGDDGPTAPSAITPRPLDSTVAWFYQMRTGQPVRFASSPSDARRSDPRPVGIGVPSLAATSSRWMTDTGAVTTSSGSVARDVIERGRPALLAPRDIHLRHLSVRSPSGALRIAVAIYAVGIAGTQEF